MFQSNASRNSFSVSKLVLTVEIGTQLSLSDETETHIFLIQVEKGFLLFVRNHYISALSMATVAIGGSIQIGVEDNEV